jgi:hypothetical protein
MICNLVYRFEVAKFVSKFESFRHWFAHALLAGSTEPASPQDELRSIEQAIERCQCSTDSRAASTDAMLNRAALHLGSRAIRMR